MIGGPNIYPTVFSPFTYGRLIQIQVVHLPHDGHYRGEKCFRCEGTVSLWRKGAVESWLCKGCAVTFECGCESCKVLRALR